MIEASMHFVLLGWNVSFSIPLGLFVYITCKKKKKSDWGWKR